ncbi:hypothetical protein QA596_01440 [Balneolales bacterium ANBcel1]|nr:hypothetical protein [Balneolales bacterium ANBcel1]
MENGSRSKSSEPEIRIVTGEELRPHLETLAHLRISVFRAFPYLYDGDMAYEQKYLSTYMDNPAAITVLVLDNGHAVGASTALPLSDETDEVKAPFLEKGLNPDEYFYFGESVLEPSWRGRGLGVRFFLEREAFARKNPQFRYLTFCAVDRPENHPLRPENYVPLDRFWEKRGFRKIPEMKTTFHWKDVGHTKETGKSMTFWIKEL